MNEFPGISVAPRSILARLVARLSVKRNLLAVTVGSIALITNLSVFFNIPAVREISGFVFLTLLPGTLLVQLFRLREFGFLGKFVLSWGLSVAFILLCTLLLNSILPQIGYSTPLSSFTLLISYDLVLVLLCVFYYRTSNDDRVQFSLGEINASNAYLYIVPLFFPLMSIFGSYAMRAADINAISIALLFLIGFYVTYVLFLKDKCPKSVYPVLIFSIGLSLLLLFTLRSNHLIGWDVHGEYYYYESILADRIMLLSSSSPQMAYPLSAGVVSMLLPVVYQLVLGADQEALFNVIFALLFSVAPLVVYLISKKYVEERYALLASLLYMSQLSFGEANLISRATIAILFFAFAFLVLFGSEKVSTKQFVLFTLFVTAGIVSHYSTAYLFLVMIIAAAILLAAVPTKKHLVTRINVVTAFLFVSVSFFWYVILIASSSVSYGLIFVRDAFNGFLFSFWTPETRGGAQAPLGIGFAEKSLVMQIQLGLTWVIVGCLLLGVATLVVKRKEMVASYAGSTWTFLRARFEIEYFGLALAATGLLVACVVVPYFAQVYSLDRTFFFVTTILSVFFVIGTVILSALVIAIVKAAHRKLKGKSATEDDGHESRRTKLQVRPNFAIALALIIIVPFLLLSSGAVHSVVGAPRGVVFDSTGAEYFEMYIHDQDSAAAKWIGTFGRTQALVSTTDSYGTYRLISQGHISPDRIDLGSFQQNQSSGTYTYLYYYNTVEQKYVDELPGSPVNAVGYMADHIALLSDQSRVFDAAGAQVYFNGSPT